MPSRDEGADSDPSLSFAPFAEPSILHEEEDFLIVLKPAGMHCLPSAGIHEIQSVDIERTARTAGDRIETLHSHPSSHPENCPDLLNWIKSRQSRIVRQYSGGFGLLHRLDFGTSGLILVALEAGALRRFQAMQSADRIVKEYRFLASESDAPLVGSKPARLVVDHDRDSGPWRVNSRFRPYGPGRKRVSCIGEEYRIAAAKEPTASMYTTLYQNRRERAVFQGKRVYECEARITRGFRHQIRAHSAWMGMPLIGDILYGGIPASRICLHAWRISFPGPDGRMLVFEDGHDGTIQAR